ncbi:hypothetical protein GGX14DRAFT_463762 [Mycena pura]|uniref:F-box domain-containing protein n=1 Tax=Mycena pura TaxID=153505 RepID=A0AAD6VB47_9AGAR|nr:hypothetical protein GGX14DRAFT_463762 [Mycena pura]
MSSPFISKIGTNYSAEENERADIEALLIEPSLRLKSLDQLQRAIDKLAEERSSLAAYIDGHNALLSPIRRMPLDIIQEIFVACMPTHRNCDMRATEAPVLLGRICSAWRAISLTTPRLWSRVHIVEPSLNHSSSSPSTRLLSLYDEALAQRLATIKTWLSRSGQCGLSITVHCAATACRPNVDYPIVTALIPFATRWEHIGLTAPNEVLASLLSVAEADVPLLKSLLVKDVQFFYDAFRHNWDSLSLCRAPNLSHLSLSGSLGNLSLEAPLRWEQLLELSLYCFQQDLTSEIVLQMLSRCRLLRTFKVLVNDHNLLPQNGPNGAALEHSFLRTLDIECLHGISSVVNQLFGRLVLPELRHLRFEGSIDLALHDRPEFSYAPFLACSPQIEHVQVVLDMFTKPSLTEFISCLPHTTQKLDILSTRLSQDYPLDEDVFSLLVPSPSGATVACPNLRDLTILGCPLISDLEVRRFVKSRMSHTSYKGLRRVAIEFRREMEIDILPDLKDFMGNGLRVQLRYLPAYVQLSTLHESGRPSGDDSSQDRWPLYIK